MVVFHVHHLFIVSENQTVSIGDDPNAILLNRIVINKNNI